MDFQLLKSIAEEGMGLAAFAVLIVAGMKVWRFMDVLVNNHLKHLQDSLGRMEAHMESMRDALNRLANKN